METTQTKPLGMDISAFGALAAEVERRLESVVASFDERAVPAAAYADLTKVRAVLDLADLGVIARIVQEIESLLRAASAGPASACMPAFEVCRRGLLRVRRAVAGLASGSLHEPLEGLLQDLIDARAATPPMAAPAPATDALRALPLARERAAYCAPEALRSARARFQKALLAWLREADDRAPVLLREVVEGIETLFADSAERAPWWIAAAFFDVLIESGSDARAQARGICAGLDLYLRTITDAPAPVPEALMQEMLRFISAREAASARVAAVRRTYLGAPSAGTTSAGETAPAVDQREQWEDLKESLEKALAGTPQDWRVFQGALQQAVKSVPPGTALESVLDQLLRSAAEVSGDATRESLAIEMASALLYVQEALNAPPGRAAWFDHVQSEACAVRLRAASEPIGRQQQFPAVPHWLQQAAAERVAAELSAALPSAVRSVEAFLADRTALAELDAADLTLKTAHGVLWLLAQPEPAAAADYCRKRIARWRADRSAGTEQEFSTVAVTLSGLSYYVEQLRFGAADFAQIMRQAGAPDFAVGTTAPAAHYTAEELLDITQAMDLDFAHPAVAAEPVAHAPVQPALETATPQTECDEAADADLLSIFIEEALEVLAAARTALDALRLAPGDAEALATIRRKFHTLKGSGRMVGLRRLAEAAARLEGVLNAVIEHGRPVGEPLIGLIDLGCELHGSWIAELQRAGRARIDSARLNACAQRCENEQAPPAQVTPPPAVMAASVSAGEREPQPPAASDLLDAPGLIDQSVEIGAVRISRALYESFMREARELLRGLCAELQAIKRQIEPGPASQDLLRYAHTLSGIAGTVRIAAIHQLAGAAEEVAHVLQRGALAIADEDQALFEQTVTALNAMVDGVAGRAQPQARADLEAELKLRALRLAEQVDAAGSAQQYAGKPDPARIDSPSIDSPAIGATAIDSPAVGTPAMDAPAMDAPVATSSADPSAVDVPTIAIPLSMQEATSSVVLDRRRTRLQDDIDLNLLPVFLDEAADLQPRIGQGLRDWRTRPTERALPQSLARALHTFKGSARMAGAMALGELTHSMEERVSVAAHLAAIPESVFDGLEHSFDRMGALMERLARLVETRPEQTSHGETRAHADTALADRSLNFIREGADQTAGADALTAVPTGAAMPGDAQAQQAALSATLVRLPVLLRVQAERVEQLLAQAGEVAIARSRLAGEVNAIRGAARDMSGNLERLRALAREMEIQAQSQMQSRTVHSDRADEALDPLELDRFTRLQELTRFISEGAADVATLQQNLSRNLDNCEAALEAQARMTRSLQDGLMSVRMVAFASLNERLFRVVRLTAREAGKRVKLDIRGDKVELDRGVIERISGPLEHLLRNAVVHGIETSPQRLAAGKPAAGEIALDVRQEGNEVRLTLRDDGRGLDIGALRAKAIEAGLIKADLLLADSQIVQFAFAAGVSTAQNVTEVAGRGVGLDVVRSEVAALGGRVEVAFEPGKGTAFSIHLPLMVAVMQALLVRCGGQLFAVPTLMVKQVRSVRQHSLARLREVGRIDWRGEAFSLHDLGALLGMDVADDDKRQRNTPLILISGGAQRVAIQVDEIAGHEEVVVKNIGAQVARVTGITGAAVRGGGEIVLILDPVQLARRSPAQRLAPQRAGKAAASALATVATVLVVDDSATVRKITSRILARQGYGVVEARDGVEALEKLRESLPAVILLDVEMPRMDGFELLRRLREEPQWHDIPVIVITSRTAAKHRKVAMDLGATLFLGKPFEEQDLLAQVARMTAGERI